MTETTPNLTIPWDELIDRMIKHHEDPFTAQAVILAEREQAEAAARATIASGAYGSSRAKIPTRELTAEEIDLVAAYNDATAGLREYKAKVAELKPQLFERLQGIGIGTIQGVPVIKRRVGETPWIDQKGLREAHPDIAEEFGQITPWETWSTISAPLSHAIQG